MRYFVSPRTSLSGQFHWGIFDNLGGCYGVYTTEASARADLNRRNFSPTTVGGTTRPERAESETVMYGITEGNLITDGASRAVVVTASETFVIARPENGGDEFVIARNDSTWSKVVSPLVIERRFVVYAPDGTRVDGYKYESRARRNNDARFAGAGYWLGEMKPEYFTFVPA